MVDKLSAYHAKRNFERTPEPHGAIVAAGPALRFVVQKHHARRLHYDFRLEIDGTLKSWAVPKGPSLDPSEKRLAVHVEDHPLDYIDFEGDIPPRQYGAGHVEVWDTGTWQPLGDPEAGYQAGKLKFVLDGEKLQGAWKLVRTGLRGNSDKEQWFLIKDRDEEARPADEYDITEALPDSVLSGKGAKKKAGKARRKVQPAEPTVTPGSLPQARAAPLPAKLAPQLATLVDAVPSKGDWVYEIKYDGYRMMARVEDGRARLYTRDGHDWTARLPQQAKAIEALGLDSAWLDGEVVVLDDRGLPSFQLLQNAFDGKRSADIVYFLFDLPYLNGTDLRKTPLRERRRMLEQVLQGHESGMLRFSATLAQPPQQLLDSACQMALEGLIGKRADAPYVSARSGSWIKLKCQRRQEMVVAGYTDPQGSRQHFGSLLLAVYGDDGALRYAGKVGTGFDTKKLAELYRKMQPLVQEACPFPKRPTGLRGGVHWIRPELVAEIAFSEWTQDGSLRHPVFQGLRVDKKAREVRREDAEQAEQLAAPAAGASSSAAVSSRPTAKSKPASAAKGARTTGASTNGTTATSTATTRTRKAKAADPVLEGVKITNPERVIDAASGGTKLDLVRYYQGIAPLILPFLQQRPVYLLRAPEGVGGEQFFQKHNTRMTIPGVRKLDIQLISGRDPLMAIETPQALVGAAQMGTIELHIPNVTADRVDRPDCMVFDLDPDPDLPWEAMVEAARLTRVVLDELGLISFLKTSGGKGLHLVVPLARRHDWDTMHGFSQAVVQHMARLLPQRFSAKMGAKNRVGKIFIDYLRNGRSASTISPYSVRARPNLPVSVPLTWEELETLRSSAQWTITDLAELLKRGKRDPWKAFFGTRQTLSAAMRKKLGIKT